MLLGISCRRSQAGSARYVTGHDIAVAGSDGRHAIGIRLWNPLQSPVSCRSRAVD
jgi:hypothetical protein